MPPLANVIVLVLLVGGVLFFLRKQIIGTIASVGGREGEAVVKAAELTDVMDERKQYHHRLLLEVQPRAGAPYDVTVLQVLPWVSGSVPVGTRLRVRVLGRTGAFVLGVARSAG